MNDLKRNACARMLEPIEALASGVDVAPDVREHLLVCPGCNAYYRSQKRLDELIRDTAGALDNPLLHGYRRPRKVKPARVAIASTALGAVLVAAISAVVIFGPGSRGEPEFQTSPMAATEQPVTQQNPAWTPPAPKTSYGEPTLLATTGAERVVQSFEGGLRLSLSGEGKASVERTGERSYEVEMTGGLLVADVPETTPRTRLSVRADNLTVTVRGTLFSVEARNRMITHVEVEHGEVEVLSRVNDTSRLVRSGESLVVETLNVRPMDEEAPSLVAAFRVEEHEAEPEKIAPKKKLTAFDRAQALRAEGRYEEAVAAFLEASNTTSGLEQERSLYQAASLSLSKLDDPQKSILHAKSYVQLFPNGIYTEDAHLLQARAHMKAKEFEKARATLIGYIDTYPQGTHSSLAHLLLGKIFATTYGNCKAAKPHLEFVAADEDGPRAQQALKILEFCNKKLGQTP